MLLVLLTITNSIYGQQQGKRISHTTLSIFNNSEKDLTIKLGLTTYDLKAYLIKSQEKWTSPTFPIRSKPITIIKTNDNEVKYTLRLNTTYMIFWDNRKKYWNLTKVIFSP